MSPAIEKAGSTGTIIEEQRKEQDGDPTGGYRVILYNDDWHSMDEVVFQLQKATGCSLEKAEGYTIEAHNTGRSIVYRGERERCRQVVAILREIRLQCEVDCD